MSGIDNMKAVVISYFKSSNIGDCILSKCLLEQFQNDFECEKVSYSLKPFEYTDINQMDEINLNFAADIKSNILFFLKKFGLHRLSEKYYWHKKYLSSFDRIKIEYIISQCDIVIIGGGNMIFDLESGSLSAGRFRYFAKIAKKNRKPVLVCSIGIGPFENDNQVNRAIQALNYADFITFRDKKSLSIFNKYGGKNGFVSSDPAFFFQKSKTKNKKKFVGINIINPSLLRMNNNEIEMITNRYIELLYLLRGHGNNIIVFTTEIRDLKYAEEIANKIGIDVKNIDSIEKLVDIYNKIFVVVGTRMHSMITAYTQEIPIIGLEWQSKISELFRYLNITEFCQPILSFSVEKINKQIEDIKTGKSVQSQEYIRQMINEQKEKLNINTQKAIELSTRRF